MARYRKDYCLTCEHDAVAVINSRIANKTESFRRLAARYGLSHAAIHRHARLHLQPSLIGIDDFGSTITSD